MAAWITEIRIPGYEVRELLGAGGMGRVYRAWNQRLERDEALKFIAPHLLTSSLARQRFHREAVSVASLSHKNIAVLYGAGEVEGNPYLAFEYLSGGTLAARIARGLPGDHERYRYASQLAQALAYAHSHGVIHRDIKPANALFDADGNLKLIDFGLVRFLDSQEAATLPGTIGTPLYMSPEQACGDPVDHRSDIYSFGVVLYELAVGRRPFDSHSVGELRRLIATEQPPSPFAHRPELDPEFGRLIEKCLQKQPEDRPKSMSEVLAELERSRVRGAAFGAAPTVTVTAVRADKSSAGQLWWRPVLAGVLSLLLLMVVVLAEPGLLARIRRWMAGGESWRPAIVVLPFESLSSEAAMVEFSAALDARLAGELVQSGRQDELFVAPVSDVRSKNVRSVGEARRALAADFVFGGSVVKGADAYEVLLSLSDAATGRQIRAEKVRVPLKRLEQLDYLLRKAATEMLPERAKPASPIVATAGQFSDASAYELCLRAQGLLRRYTGRASVDSAIQLLEEAARLDARSAEVQAWTAEAWLQKFLLTKEEAHLKAAEAAVAEATRLDPTLRAVRVAAGRVAERRGNSRLAIAQFEAALTVDPRDPEVHRFIGRLHLDAGRKTEAERAYRKAVELNPNYEPARTSLGYCLFRLNRPAEALVQFQRAAELLPDNPRALSNLGGAYFQLNRIEEAAAAFEASLSKGPDAPACSNLGTIRFTQGRYAEAADLFRRAIGLRPNEAALWSYLAETYVQMPDKSAAAQQAFRTSAGLFEDAIQINPKDSEAWSQLGMARASLGDARGAREAGAMAARLTPADANVIYRLARMEVRLGNLPAASAHLQRALQAGFSRSEAAQEPDFRPLRQDRRFRNSIP